jgi:hypothetical protein
MIKRIERRIGRAALLVLGFFVVTLLVCVPIGVFGSSNLVWGEDDQYGRVDVPGTKVLHLPGGSVDVNAAVEIPGQGNATGDLPLPSDLALTVAPVDGSGHVGVRRDVGSSGNANDDSVNTQRRVWKLDVPHDGDYSVTAGGDFLGDGVNPQFWFGHGPPIPGTLVPVIAAILTLIGGSVWLLVLPRVRRGRPTPASAPVAPARPAPELRQPQVIDGDPVERLRELADLHDHGALTDAEFATEKARIIGGG